MGKTCGSCLYWRRKQESLRTGWCNHPDIEATIETISDMNLRIPAAITVNFEYEETSELDCSYCGKWEEKRDT